MTPDVAEIAAILTVIDKHPEQWNQEYYCVETECGTAYCVAGFALIRAGYKAETSKSTYQCCPDSVAFYNARGEMVAPEETAREILGLTWNQSDDLFWFDNSREDLQRVFEQIAATVPVAAP